MWFERLMGFHEVSPEQVRQNISLEKEVLRSHVNGKTYICGSLEIPSLGELRRRIEAMEVSFGDIFVREVVADVQELHADPSNADALFQVASQFNLLEMMSPNITPEEGVGQYQYDRTQGPACAIAAGAGTIYRNYFVPLNGRIGQTADNQIDTLADIGEALGNRDNHLWHVRNGYVLASEEGLREIGARLRSAGASEIDHLRSLLRVGIQWHTEVTIADTMHTVSQVYCAALPVAYLRHPPELWSAFAQLVLEASYEATFCAAILNFMKTGNNKLYLTLLGGGVFGNEKPWIINAIRRSLEKYRHTGLDVMIVSHGASNRDVWDLMR